MLFQCKILFPSTRVYFVLFNFGGKYFFPFQKKKSLVVNYKRRFRIKADKENLLVND